jgi:hypothetical protein
VQRYERALGLPIYRPSRRSPGSVVATKAALDAWVTTDRTQILSAISRDRTNRVGADFVCIDAELALTFSGLALASNDPAKKSRRAETARKAYDTIMQLRRNVDLGDEQRERLNANLERLKSELQSIGVQVLASR